MLAAALCMGSLTVPGRFTESAAAEPEYITSDRIEITADDYQSGNEPAKAIDGDANTIWHSSWSNRHDLPLSITLSLKEPVTGIAQIAYLPRQDKDKNGIITKYRISVSTDGENFTQIAEGIWADDKSEKTATFDAQKEIKAIRLTAVETASNNGNEDSLYVSAAEIKIARREGFVRDTARLEELVKKAENLAAVNPDAGLEDLKKTLEKGKELLGNGYAVQEELERAIQDLEMIVDIKTTFSGVEGRKMYATNGELIQAHGGQITKWGDTYYWYGGDRSGGGRVLGVHLYTSKDLYHWEDKGLVMKMMTDMAQFTEDAYFSSLYGDLDEAAQQEVWKHLQYGKAILERPKVLYNEKTKKYVLWFHADGPTENSGSSYAKAMSGVAVSDTPEGPFRFIKASRMHSSDAYTGKEKGMARDMNVFRDEDGSAYILYASEENASLYISKLSDDYLDLAVRENAVEGVDYSRNFVNTSREAPAMFKYQGKYYLMTSGCTGWAPNEAKYYEADTPLGPWKEMGNPCVGEENDTTFRTQSTCIFAVDAAKGKFVYMGDRWNSSDQRESRYVLLPVDFGYQYHMTIPNRNEWSIENMTWNSGFELKKEDQPDEDQIIGQEEKLDAFKNRKVTLKTGDGSDKQAEVTWNAVKTVDSDAVGLGRLEAEIRLDDGSSIKESIPANWYQKKTVYFVDCQNPDSEYVRGFKKVGIHLKNKVSDQKFDGTWGLVNDPGEYNKKGIFEGGYWARAGESIVYRFILPAGTYQANAGVCEWWTETRHAKLNVSLVKDGENEETKQLLASTDMKTQNGDKSSIFSTGFELSEDAVIEISVDKVSGGDPLLSWLSIIDKNKSQETETGTESESESETTVETETETESETTVETETESETTSESTTETETESESTKETSHETETESQRQTETKVPQETKKTQETNKNEQPTTDTASDVKVGSIVRGDKTYDNYTYKVLNKNTVEIHKITTKGKKVRNLKISDTVKIQGKTYKVTRIADGALQNQKKVQTLTIGKNMTAIGKNAFKGCKNLKKIIVKSKKLKKIGKNAFQNVKKAAYVKVPKGKAKSYQKMLQKAGLKIRKIK